MPVEACSLCPTESEPEIAGNPVFTGELAFAVTTVVKFEKVDVFPDALVAVTVARSSEPIWVVPTTKLDPVAPATSAQTELTAVQLCH